MLPNLMARRQTIEELAHRPFDALVIGGGITGAGIARDAALRGLSVALIDKGDFASGTSSRSSRLIHGGVRYLEHGYLRLVFEASAERRRLLRLAPHLVRPLPFTWPVYSGQRLPIWKLAAGLTLYDLLSLFRNVGRHRRLSPTQVLAHEPSVVSRELLGGVRYWDAATDDARLTLANILDAQSLGAITANHVSFRETVISAPVKEIGPDHALRVVRLRDELTGKEFEARARTLVNAAGPWTDMVREREGAIRAKPGRERARIQGSKGAHIAVPRDRIGNHHALTMLHPEDGRVLFALPADTHTIIGTTDTFTDISADDVRASRADVDYLLDAANRFFPGAHLDGSDVVAAWAGIRPLMPSTGTAGAASREHAVERTNHGTITITGGKLTTYRVMARDATDAIEKAVQRRRTRAATSTRALPGGDVAVSVAIQEARRVPTDSAQAAHLVHAYGSAWRDVHAYCDRDAASRAVIADGLPYRMGEMRWAVERELACTLGDLLIRRTHVAFETRDNGRAAARAVADYLGLAADAVAGYDAEAARMFTIDP